MQHPGPPRPRRSQRSRRTTGPTTSSSPRSTPAGRRRRRPGQEHRPLDGLQRADGGDLDALLATARDRRATRADGVGWSSRRRSTSATPTSSRTTPSRRDDPKQPFKQRQAPPILIWRYLAEQCGVDPATSPSTRNLKVDKDFPLPDDSSCSTAATRTTTTFTARRLPARHLQPAPAGGLGRPARLLRVHRQEHGVARPDRAGHRPGAPPAGRHALPVGPCSTPRTSTSASTTQASSTT